MTNNGIENSTEETEVTTTPDSEDAFENLSPEVRKKLLEKCQLPPFLANQYPPRFHGNEEDME